MKEKFNVRTLILNKFLHRNGGSETYIFKLGEALEQHGHEVQYFGMEHKGRCVGNRVNAYTKEKLDDLGGCFVQIDFDSTNPMAQTNIVAYKQLKALLKEKNF